MKIYQLVFLCLFWKSISSQTVISFVHTDDEPKDGRIILIISDTNNVEPRFQVRDDYQSAQIIGQDVEDWQPDKKLVLDSKQYFGYPKCSMSDLKDGWYYVQAVLNTYKTYHLATGHTVKLPPDKGEGQHWNTKPGNIYSSVSKIYLSAKKTEVTIVLDQKIQPIKAPEDTKYVKHIKMKSKLLSDFWGEDVYLGAHVLLPYKFEEDTALKYPLMVFHGHFPKDFGGWSEVPPPNDMDTSDYSERFGVYGYGKFQKQEAFHFYQQWTSDTFPRYLIIEIQHPTPYYDDSYAVNSQCQGPYGDAITYELIPYIEQQFRGIGEGWARFLYGGSTGGWEALAAQVFYPDEYNGCFAACPDPIDFRAYTVVNIYNNKNAYEDIGPFSSIERPGKRDYRGHISTTLRDANYYELALGSKSRSGQQWDIWEATYSPMASDGYPRRIWDKVTGEIDQDVALYWKENYDLGHIIERDWNRIGRKLEGKIHLYCGDMDNYYLNNAVYLVEEMLKNTKNPNFNGEVKYGDRAEHCWNGDQNLPNYVSRLRYNTMYIPKIARRLQLKAPSDEYLKKINFSKK